MRTQFLSIAACGLLGAGAIAQPTVANTEVPITSIRFVGAQKGGQARGVFIVPDVDTTRSAYGGKLSRYDVHISKMLEVANLYCSNSWNSVEWHYFAGDGEINMGRFVMSCNLVRDIHIAYGTGRPERTVIRYGYGYDSASEERYLPVLNLNGDKIPKFQSFVQRFTPVGKAQRIDSQ
ncbi:hypothetical protein [Microcoleus sp. FACHB-68]|uniref:hypothetical protein n=1 Tax=Microcoleus sp. FACHB-68 TaxID=2692826 RepID=UPI00168A2FCB|nr:hypothetical protein [Microcoleus sp. FACHB-68]MBD1940657.1 hypothetical protein [Microcoleus sp. FACHB-68]